MFTFVEENHKLIHLLFQKILAADEPAITRKRALQEAAQEVLMKALEANTNQFCIEIPVLQHHGGTQIEFHETYPHQADQMYDGLSEDDYFRLTVVTEQNRDAWLKEVVPIKFKSMDSRGKFPEPQNETRIKVIEKIQHVALSRAGQDQMIKLLQMIGSYELSLAKDHQREEDSPPKERKKRKSRASFEGCQYQPQTWEQYRKNFIAIYGGEYEEKRETAILHQGIKAVFGLLSDEFPEPYEIFGETFIPNEE
jgi:hypothetical protein